MPSIPSTLQWRAWLFALAYGSLAYTIHRVGAFLGYYRTFWWFQVLTHFLSATAMALLLLRTGHALSLEGRTLLTFVVALSIVGAVGWELVEYFDLIPWLHWWGLDDSLLDLGVDAVGILTVLVTIAPDPDDEPLLSIQPPGSPADD